MKELLNRLPKLMWYLPGIELPRRQALSYLNFCVHAEMLYDDEVYEALVKFSKDFSNLTGKRIAVCISTPDCPLVREAVSKNKFPEEDFASRVLEMARFSDIGYHGHFYGEGQTGLIQVSRDYYVKGLVASEIEKEMGWFRKIGIHPRIYVAGWWFMTSDIVLELERLGIELDVSIRKGKDDTFGGRYMKDDALPRPGEPFILPPSKNIVEIQSVFGPVMPSPVMKGHLARYLESDTEENLFFIFPLHDWDVPRYYRNIWRNVEELSKSRDSVGWMNVLDMCQVYLNSMRADRVERR